MKVSNLVAVSKTEDNHTFTIFSALISLPATSKNLAWKQKMVFNKLFSTNMVQIINKKTHNASVRVRFEKKSLEYEKIKKKTKL